MSCNENCSCRVETMKFCKVRDVKTPVRAHDLDAGIDFFVPNDFQRKFLEPNEDILIPSGIRMFVPKGYALIMKEKSGVCLKRKLTCGSSVVDSGYESEIHIHLFNNGRDRVPVEPGDKIIQGVLVKLGTHSLQEISVDDFNSRCGSERGLGGFGSTGSK